MSSIRGSTVSLRFFPLIVIVMFRVIGELPADMTIPQSGALWHTSLVSANYASQGFKTATPASAKCDTFRVTVVRL